jgi:ABC-type glutathione transport system ATPase component
MATVMSAMAADGVSVLLSSHVLTELERVASYLILLARGRVRLAGEVGDLLATHRQSSLEELALSYLRRHPGRLRRAHRGHRPVPAEVLRGAGGDQQGAPTSGHLRHVLNRLTLPGSIYLALVAMFPLVALDKIGLGQDLLLSGVSLLIMVSVGLDTVKQTQSQLEQHSYQGFLH